MRLVSCAMRLISKQLCFGSLPARCLRAHRACSFRAALCSSAAACTEVTAEERKEKARQARHAPQAGCLCSS